MEHKSVFYLVQIVYKRMYAMRNEIRAAMQ